MNTVQTTVSRTPAIVHGTPTSVRYPARGRICTACAHPLRVQLDIDLAARVKTIQVLANEYNLNRGALTRHRQSHLIRTVEKHVEKIRAVNEARVNSAFETRSQETWDRTTRNLDIADGVIAKDPNQVFNLAGLLGQAAKLLEQQGRAEGVLLGGSAAQAPAVHHHQHLHQVLVMPGANAIAAPESYRGAIAGPVLDAEPVPDDDIGE